MAGKKNSKLKLLYLKDIFEEYSDDEHILNSIDIASHLEARGIECERKSIYKDIEVLVEYGMDINKTKTPKNGFYLGQREFEPAEIRLLNDAVQSAHFISKKKTKMLLQKTDRLVSRYQSDKLKKQVFIDNRNKCSNEEIFYNINTLDEAIKNQKKVHLIYSRRRIDEKFTQRTEKKEFVLSPYALIWSNDRYYLVANNGKYDNTMNLRVDRIHNVEILDENFRHFSEVTEYKTAFNSADYSEKTFNMYSGKPETTELRCKTAILEQMIDKFGEKVPVKKADDGWFCIHSDLSINDGLASWIMQYGDNIEVVYPESLRKLIYEKAKKISEVYASDGRR